MEAALRRAGVPAAFTPIGGQTRHTFTIVDGAGAVASFNEAGPEVTMGEFNSFRQSYREALAGAEAVVLSGSLPPGLPATTYAALIQAAAAAGVPVILDAFGQALLRGVSAGPAIVKPNLDELSAVSGRSLATADGVDRAAVSAAAAGLRAAGAEAVVASLGPAGLLAVTREATWHARPSAVVEGNATGAGDAVAAALAHGLALGRPWDERLRHAVALGAAAAAAPVAGEFSHDSYQDGLHPVAVRLEEVR